MATQIHSRETNNLDYLQFPLVLLLTELQEEVVSRLTPLAASLLCLTSWEFNHRFYNKYKLSTFKMICSAAREGSLTIFETLVHFESNWTYPNFLRLHYNESEVFFNFILHGSDELSNEMVHNIPTHLLSDSSYLNRALLEGPQLFHSSNLRFPFI